MRIVQLILGFVVMTTTPCAVHGNMTKLYLMGLFPGSGAWAGAESAIPATQLAIQDINNNPAILPGYEIVVLPRDTECDGGKAIDEMYKELYDGTTTKHMILGAGCSFATESTAQASHHWNLIQMSYAAASPQLSRRDLYPRFFRLYPPDTILNIAKLALFREFNWTKVGTIHESLPVFSLAIADFHTDAHQAGIEVIAAESFVDDPTTHMEHIAHSGARIIVGAFYGNMARRVFCAAYHEKMYGAKYVWIVPGWLEADFWRVPDESIDCTLEEIEQVADNHIGISVLSLPSDDTRAPTLSGMTSRDFLERFKEITATDDPESLTGFNDIAFSYDTVWAASLALHEAQSQLGQLDPPRTLDDFAYDNATVRILFDIISNMAFEGVSGPVKFTSSGDRVGLIQIRQLQGDSRVYVGMMDPVTGSEHEIIWDENQQIHWAGGAPPIDFIIEREVLQTIQPVVFTIGVIFATVGIALASFFLAFNIHFRKLRVIKMSSPNINNLMLIGGVLAYASIIFMGVDTAITSTSNFVNMCRAKTWCLSIGFSLAFGSMFSKTWRVHKIFTNKTVLKTAVKDQRLFSSVATLVFLDVFILVLWEIVDPIRAVEHRGDKVVDHENDDIVYTPIRTMCESTSLTYWIGAFYIMDGLLLILGAFLAWETRYVSIPALNDSKYVGVCVYNILIMSLVGAPVSFVLEERNAHYALVATLIWLATTLTLCVVFVPKIRMRNDIQPTQNTTVSNMVVAHAPSGNSSSDAHETEIQMLRQEIVHLKENCKCSLIGTK